MKLFSVCISILCICYIGLGQKTSTILDRVLGQTYDWRERPVPRTPGPNGTAVQIQVNIYFRQIKQTEEGFKVEITFRQTWSDPRLAYGSGPSYLTLPSLDKSRRIWTPDTFFQNAHDVKPYSDPNPNELIRIHLDGNVLFSQRLSMVLWCPMSFEGFPSDKQICNLDLASYGHTSDDIVYIWKSDNPLQLRDALKKSMAQFELVNTTTEYCTSQTATGTYSCLRASLHLKRTASIGLKTKLYAIPLILVIISWVPFIINAQSLIVRVLIALVCLATLILHWSLVAHDLPKVGYTTGADEFLARCLGFITATFIQLIFYAWITRTTSSYKQRKLAKERANKAKDTHEDGATLIHEEPSPWKSDRSMKTDLLVDVISLAIFILAFLVFLLHYFTKY